MRELLRYGIAVVVYLVIGLYTKRLLTWTMGPLYFLVALELLPRMVRSARARVAR